MPAPGDRVKVVTGKRREEGILMPSPDEKVLIIKLDNGYNIGFEKKEVKELSLIEKSGKEEMKLGKVEKRKDLPTIAILHTGGTIASKVDYRTGGVATEFSPEELIGMFPELKSIANIESELIAQMWSDDLRFSHLSLIAKKVEEYVKRGVKGVIIGMGTDNLAVAAAGLSFIIESSPIPIIFVGAQRSSDRGSSDAGMNLICAAEFITKSDFVGVAICVHEMSDDQSCAILPANKTYKLHSSRRDAFKAVNTDIIARIDYKSKKVHFLTENYLGDKKSEKLIIKPKMEEKVGLLKIHVNMFPEEILAFKGFKGLIIEGTGLGHAPTQVPNKDCKIHEDIKKALQELIDSGCVVIMTTQCIFGGVNMNVYDKGRDLLEMEVIPGKDMLSNTALVKLSWLLGNYPREKVKKLMTNNLRGEINESISFEEDFV